MARPMCSRIFRISRLILNHFGIFDGIDNFHVAAAFDAGFNINVKHPREQPCPGNVLLFQLQLLGVNVVLFLADYF